MSRRARAPATPPDVRVAGTGDAAALADLVIAFREELREATPADARVPDALDVLLHDPGAEFALAEGADGWATGYVQSRYRYSLWLPGFEAELEDLFVRPGARRAGVGARLVAFAVERARRRGCRRIGLGTNERNLPALRLYERAGFRADRPRWESGRQLWLERTL